ncbi:appA [Symbiodinium sp. KB8]|nr:appA [Symbiodinium sp. KB8]
MGRANFSSVKCNEVAVYADTHSRRDIETATNWTAGAFPSCDALHAEDVIYGDPDKQLFNDGTNDTLCQYPSKDVILALLGGSDGGFAALRDSWGSEIDTIDRVVNCCPVNMCGTQPCNLSAIPITYEGKPWAATGGGHDLAIFWAEFFLLEYLNGNKQFALGQLSPDELVRLYRMAVDYLEIMDSALAAPSFESTLAAQIVASMVQARSGQPVPGVRHPPSAKVVYMAGHDTNLVLLRKLLGLRWHTAGWAENAAPPGGMLIFELADVPGRGFEVSAYFQAARPEQLREGQDFASQAPPRSPAPSTRVEDLQVMATLVTACICN